MKTDEYFLCIGHRIFNVVGESVDKCSNFSSFDFCPDLIFHFIMFAVSGVI